MSNQNSKVDEMLGFDPTNLTVFEEKQQSSSDNSIYKTSTKETTSKDGNYYSKVRVLLNPFNPNNSIIHSVRYAMTDENGFFMADSVLAKGSKDCPIFKAWKQLHFSGDEAKDAWAKEMFDKAEANWVLVQIIEDDNKPELVGQFKCMKLPRAIFDKLTAKLKPTDGKTAPQNVMDYLFGPLLNINVQAGPDGDVRRTNYNLCDFDTDPYPIIKVDGTALFSDEEIETIEAYDKAKKDYNKVKNDEKKSQKVKDDKLKACAELVPAIRPLMERAIDYVKENTCNLEDVCGYHEWSADLTQRVTNWISNVLAMRDPKTAVSDAQIAKIAAGAQGIDAPAPEPAPASIGEDEDLPF
jgi:hypothetical protein